MQHDDIDTALHAPLAALRSASASLAAPPAVERALMAAFARQARRLPWYRRWNALQLGLAGGMGSAMAAALLFLLLPNLQHSTVPASGEESAFVALESRERILQEPSPRVVQADVPRTMLSSAGMPISPENAGDTVRAELLLGADGSALAVRFISTQ